MMKHEQMCSLLSIWKYVSAVCKVLLGKQEWKYTCCPQGAYSGGYIYN